MSTVICHKDGRYNIYGSICDRFYWTKSISLDQLKSYIKDEHGNEGIRGLDDRLERAYEYGTSSHYAQSIKDVLVCNRAGPEEKHLSLQECIDQFLT